MFPTDQRNTGTARFRLDNIRWVAETDALPKEQIDLPVTFEEPNVDYSLSDFNGASSVVGPDPDDATNTVAATTKTVGADFFAGTVIGKDFGGFASPIPFTATDTIMTVMVRSPAAGINVKLKVENAADGNIAAEVDVPTTVANAWEKLSFDFASAPGFDPNIEYSKAIIFFDFVDGKPGDGSTYYWDDLALGDLIQQIDLPVTFDEPFVDYVLSDFGNASTSVGDDPTGAANKVGITVKAVNAETFAGTVVARDFGSFANPIPFTAADTVMSVRTFAPVSGITVKLKVENADATVTSEVDVVNTVANAWESLNFDFTGAPGFDPSVEYVRAVIFFDFGNVGDGSTYYWDDLQFGVRPSQIDLPVTFDEPFVDYVLSDFGNAGTSVGDDPTGAANKVGVTVKAVDAETFAGTVVARDFGSFANPIPFTALDTVMSMRSFAPVSGITVKLKVENADATVTSEVDVVNTVANAWEPLNFDFTGAPGFDPSVEYVRAVIFFDFGNVGDGSTYYWDDLRFGAQP